MREAIRHGAGQLWGLLPRGTPLPDEDWAGRHATISTIALLHVPAVFAYALLTGVGLAHAALETFPVAALALLGRGLSRTRLAREVATTLSLVTSSAVLVHLSGGYIELHFHFFVIVALVTLYQQWNPFLLAIGFVALHHGVVGALDPTSVYNHPSALANPWRWAGIHAAFIAMASAVGMANWKLNEVARQRAEGFFRRLYEGERAVVQRLEAADRVKAELVAAVSHEFRTPLTAILGFAHTLERRANLSHGQIREFGSKIYRQGRRLQHLVENLLEAEKPLDAPGGTCDADAAIRTSVDVAAAGSRHGERPFHIDVMSGLQLHLAPETTQLVLTNLIGNALKFATPGTPIALRAFPSRDGGAGIEVSNHGPPVPPQLRDRIFEPFVQGDSSTTRAADGVGLGLHIVRRIVTAAHGSVTVACRGGVTTFTVWIPANGEVPADEGEGLVAQAS